MLTAAELNGAKVRMKNEQARANKMFDQSGLYLHVTETGSNTPFFDQRFKRT